MARRKNAKRKRPESRQKYIKRQENTRNQLKLVIIACEGTKTEPAYFQKLFDQLKQKHRLSRESCVIALHRHTDPPGVLQDLLNRLLGKPYNKADGEIYTLLECRMPTAVKNATRLQEDASTRGVLPADTNPGTAVHTLVAQLLAI